MELLRQSKRRLGELVLCPARPRVKECVRWAQGGRQERATADRSGAALRMVITTREMLILIAADRICMAKRIYEEIGNF
eukprot:1146594-Pleurochrysis_carterae.AAC.2